MQNFSRYEKCDGHKTEHRKLVYGLDLAPLLRPVAIGHEGGRADVAEAPAKAEQIHRRIELSKAGAAECDHSCTPSKINPVRKMRSRP